MPGIESSRWATVPSKGSEGSSSSKSHSSSSASTAKSSVSSKPPTPPKGLASSRWAKTESSTEDSPLPKQDTETVAKDDSLTHRFHPKNETKKSSNAPSESSHLAERDAFRKAKLSSHNEWDHHKRDRRVHNSVSQDSAPHSSPRGKRQPVAEKRHQPELRNQFRAPERKEQDRPPTRGKDLKPPSTKDMKDIEDQLNNMGIDDLNWADF